MLGVKLLRADRQNNTADLNIDNGIFLFVIDDFFLAEFLADPAFALLQIDAVFLADDRNRRDRLREGDAYALGLVQVLVVFIGDREVKRC